jgi:hypothetical protein
MLKKKVDFLARRERKKTLAFAVPYLLLYCSSMLLPAPAIHIQRTGKTRTRRGMQFFVSGTMAFSCSLQPAGTLGGQEQLSAQVHIRPLQHRDHCLFAPE